MSRWRLSAKVRKNADFIALTRFLDEHGLPHEVVKPNGKGHPALRITLPCGKTMDHFISCTPRGWCNAGARVAELKRALIAAGVAQ